MSIQLGPMDIPIPVRPLGMTDRSDGTKWWLKVTDDHVAISDQIPRDCEMFGPYDGPYVEIPGGAVSGRLFIEEGRIGIDYPTETFTRPILISTVAKPRPDRTDPLYQVFSSEDWDNLPRLAFAELTYP